MLVLVGVDRSSGARAALRWADRFAERRNARVVAVSAWQYPRTAALPGGPTPVSPDEMDAETYEEGRSIIVDELGQRADGVRLVVQRGPADWALLNAATSHGADLMVVGTRGLGSLEGRLLGSVSRRVAELGSSSVAVVPPGWNDIDGPVVVGVDGSTEAATALGWAAHEAQTTSSEMVLVHGVAGLPAELPPSAIDRFVARASELVDRLAADARAAGSSTSTVVEVMDPRHLIDAVARERDARLVVVGAKGEGAASGLLIGSVVNHIVQRAERPVVVVR